MVFTNFAIREIFAFFHFEIFFAKFRFNNFPEKCEISQKVCEMRPKILHFFAKRFVRWKPLCKALLILFYTQELKKKHLAYYEF